MSALSAALLLGAHTPASAQGLPPLEAVVGHDAAVSVLLDGLQIRFAPAEWPNAAWQAGAGHSWDWRGKMTFAFDAANPNTEPINFSVRIDDDPSADGVRHCRTVNASLGPRESAAFCADLAAVAPMAEGMRGAPPLHGTSRLRPLPGSGEIDPAHITAFQFFTHRPSHPLTLRITHLRLLPSPPALDRFRGIVDAYGQYTGADWPGKVHAASELSAARTAEAQTLAAAPALPGRDDYGGWSAGPKIPTHGYFSTVKRSGRWWLVTPAGHLFLSFGLDSVQVGSATVVHPRDALFTALPAPGDPLAKHYGTDDHILYGPYKSGRTFDFYAANLERKYGPDYLSAWRSRTLARLRSWGFNTLGNWSDEDLEAAHQVPYTATLGVGGDHARLSSGSDYWGRMHDPFDPQFAADCEAAFRDKATRLRDDSWCLGYFVDNELSWGGGTVERGRYGLAYGALAADAAQPAKRALLAQLRSRYGTIAAFNTAWNTSLSRWEDLDAPYQASQSPTVPQEHDMAAFVYSLAIRYFTVVRDALKKYDSNHLYLGCRFAGGCPPEAVRAAAEVCDVVSLNVYRPQLDGADLQQTWGLTPDMDKPCLIGEFHFGSLDRGLFHPGLVAASSQAERAAMFRRYIESVVDNPAFVGAHWFQYGDEPLTGRSLDGENYNIGFVSVTDMPYPGMVQAARLVLSEAYKRRASPTMPNKRKTSIQIQRKVSAGLKLSRKQIFKARPDY